MPSPSSLLPAHDEARLRALSRYQGREPVPESLLADMVALTAKLFVAPIVLISFVEAEQVRLAASYGLPAGTTAPRDQSLCSVVILQEGVTVFEDLHRASSPLIQPQTLHALQLRFYAGHPLRTPDGFSIGSLCIIDRKARSFSPTEHELLRRLATTVMLLLERQRARAGRPSAAVGSPAEAAYTIAPPLIQRLAMLADIGSTGAAVDAWGTAVNTDAIQQEATRLTGVINQTLTTSLPA